MINILSAHTQNTNNAESDKQKVVLHDVHIELNGKVEIISIMAECPLDALNIAHEMSEDECIAHLKENLESA